MRVNRIAPLLATAALLIAACSTSTRGSGEQAIDVANAKITGTVTVSPPASMAGTLLISPDGRRVFGTKGATPCVFDVDGSNDVCAGKEVSVDVSRAVWSPDGTHVAFTDDFYRMFWDPDIWVLDAATGQVTDLTDDGVAKVDLGHKDPKANYDLLPRWSPDSKSVRFARQAGDYAGPTIDIDSVPVSGGQVSRLGTLPGRLIELAGLSFAPDAKTMAWSQGADSGWSKSTVYVGPLGDPGKALSDQPVQGDQSLLSFSPDGTYLLVDSFAPYGQFSCCPRSSARVYRADGSDAQPVTKGAVALYPGWAPSGHALAFSTPIPHASVDLVAEPGGAAHVLESGEHRFGAPNTVRIQWTRAGLFVFQDTKPVVEQLGG
ncbi:MAG TPA: hypothetical protein VH373_00035 [Jatrophihabitantaceae bacterium]